VAYLLPHFPQALHTAEQVAAPQQLAANVIIYQVSVCLRRDLEETYSAHAGHGQQWDGEQRTHIVGFIAIIDAR
jgi:hypothetical protein